MTNDALGDRMKSLESIETERRCKAAQPIYARIDGRGFSKFTKGMERPFCPNMTSSMVDTTKVLIEKTHATIGFVQSDEISLAWIPTAENHGWFDGKYMKMTSVLASLAASAFIRSLKIKFPNWEELMDKLPHFDARVVSMPNEMETANMFVWRNLDATKNAISMAAHHHFGHSKTHGCNSSEKIAMLNDIGIVFDNYPESFRKGTFVRRQTFERKLSEETWNKIPIEKRPDPNTILIRSEVVEFYLPPLINVMNKIDALFYGKDPITQ